LDLRGLIISITVATTSIDAGRKGFATRGKEGEGRISYEDGIAAALSVFQEAQITADSQALILAEYTFITQEYQLCEKSDKDTVDSLIKAIESFDDAFLALRALVELDCKSVDSFFPHNGKYRVSGYPKDACHIACIAHRTRLQNILRTPGIDPIEKTLLKQRRENIYTAQNAYIKIQKKVFTTIVKPSSV
jgi:hypothetical protein